MSEITNNPVSPANTEPLRPKRKSIKRNILLGILVLVGVCLLLTAISVVSNLTTPKTLPVPDRLTYLDKARLAEAYHLRQIGTLQNALLPGD